MKALSGFDFATSTIVSHKKGLTQRGDLTVVSNLHRDDMPGIDSIDIHIRPDRAAWQHAADEASRANEPPIPPLVDASVSIRLSDSGTHLDVEAPTQSNVDGLTDGLVTILERGARGRTLRIFTGGVTGTLLAALITMTVVVAGIPVIRALDLASQNGEWELPELAVLIVGPIIGPVVGVCWWFLFPTVEVLDDGQERRVRRFRGLIVGGIATLVLGIVGAAIYDVLN